MINRRDFLKRSSIAIAGAGLSNYLSASATERLITTPTIPLAAVPAPDIPFRPRRVASWWNTLEDLQWPQKVVRDRVKMRAEGFATANIDTAMNYGFHVRFDYSNYFGRLNEYFHFVKEELDKYGIKFIEHYSCNHVHQPRSQEDYERLHRSHRHHVLLYHDPEALEHMEYEGHRFRDLFEVDLIDGSVGYSQQYYMNAFCHNNPGFIDMHKKYLERLVREVGFDGYEIDDMCDYVGLRACGCIHCRERFKKDYGREFPPFSDKSFWGDTDKPMLQWGNYDNPIFRDWINMKDDIIADHVEMVKQVIGNKPLFTCCSSTGPILLNSISLNLERIADKLDFYMLENVSMNVRSVNWIGMDAEALQQKDIARERGNSPAMALSYTIYPDGGYLGWSLARFWGVANWASTHNRRIYEEDPVDMMETEDIIRPYNNWETKYSDLDHHHSKDIPEVRLTYNYYCRINGWRDPKGVEHWSKTKAWSHKFVENSIGYRILRYRELADANQLLAEKTPIILDGVGSVSDAQYDAIVKYLSRGGTLWLSLPFGTHDEKGNKRERELSEKLLRNRWKNLKIIDSITDNEEIFSQMTKGSSFEPVIRQISGDPGWVVRLRNYDEKMVIHFMNSRLQAIPHPTVKDISLTPVVDRIESKIKDNRLKFELDTKRFNVSKLSLYSPELKGEKRNITITAGKRGKQILEVDLSGINIYAAAQ